MSYTFFFQVINFVFWKTEKWIYYGSKNSNNWILLLKFQVLSKFQYLIYKNICLINKLNV